MALLEVKDLDVRFAVRGGDLTALRGISFSLDKASAWGWWVSPVPVNPWPRSRSST